MACRSPPPADAACSALQVGKPPSQRATNSAASRAQPRIRAGRRAAVVAAAAPPAAEVEVREEKLEGAATRLHITVPAPTCQASYKKIMAELRKGTTVDGYRKGKVSGRKAWRMPANPLFRHNLQPAGRVCGWHRGGPGQAS